MFLKRKEKKLKKTNLRKVDNHIKNPPNYTLLITVVALHLFGLLMIFSASALIAYLYNDGDTFYFVKRQILWIGLGAILGFIAYKLPMANLRKLSVFFVIFTIFLMIYLIPEAIFNIEMPFVDTLNGATRWINIANISLQPAELAKLSIILFSATWFTLSKKRILIFEKFINSKGDNPIYQSILLIGFKTLPFIILLIFAGLILIQKDLDTIIIIGLILISIFYLSNTGRKHNLTSAFLLLGGSFVGLLAVLLTNFRLSRFQSFLQILLSGEPTEASKRAESFQVWNGLIALGLGGLIGVGYGQSRQKLFFLQEAAYTDSIFTIIGEEFGLLGTIGVIAGFVIIFLIGLKIAKNASTKFNSLVAIGITAWITIQAFLNIAANLSIIPFGGMPLPFLTYGGSNTIMILIGVGLLLNISRDSRSN